jgi:predicted nucleic acid-binding protein
MKRVQKIILDTSVIVKFFTSEQGSTEAQKILLDIKAGKYKVVLPELVKYELANVLFKGKKLLLNKTLQILTVFYHLPFKFVAEDWLLAQFTSKLASERNITYYDACFLALALKEHAVLITANPKHQQKVRGLRIRYI